VSSNRILFGGMAALLIGGVIFLIVQMSSVSSSGVKVGARPAAASCTKENTVDCLPKVTFIDSKQEFWTPELLAGKVVVVNFWATWCKPCRKEIPAFSRAYDKYKDQGLALFGVMTDDPSDSELGRFSAEVGIHYPVVRVDQELMHVFEYPEALPTTFVYDRAGNLRVRHRGGLTDGDLEQMIGSLLAEGTPGHPAPVAP
jgi:thiol-disulfide isomerase/thioredoxin